MAKPFLKWAGGKTQLIHEISRCLPAELKSSELVYVEPFVGSGAVLFWMLEHFPGISKAVINDVNHDLVNCYEMIAANPNELIAVLEQYQDVYQSLEASPDKKNALYYEKRDLFNSRTESAIKQAALLIFLNRTCFNGLYRVNKSNLFNVPVGSYKKPTICDKQNILSVSSVLQKVDIMCGDFESTLEKVGDNAFFYFDPPYKPLNNTSSFKSYAKDDFNDSEQVRLRDFCARIDKMGYKWILSNSDVKNLDPDNHFFDDLYAGFPIKRVKAKRSINANGAKRGELNELIITNFKCPG